MPDEASSPFDMRSLMAAIGETLLLWGYLETAVRERLTALGKNNSTESKAPLLTLWLHAERSITPNDPELLRLEQEIASVATIRNSLAHGLSSASADPRDPEGPRVVCVDRKGDATTYSLSTLEHTKQKIHEVRVRVQKR